MNRQEAVRLARERAVNVMNGDLITGGFSAALGKLGYSIEESIKVEKEYQEQIDKISAKLARGHNES